jgi:DNA replication and repair protein RecF
VGVESIAVSNFRNFSQLRLDLDPGTNLLLGANGAGKTNILEAIHYLGLARSQRRESGDHEVANSNGDFFRVEGVIRGAGGDRLEVEIAWSRKTGKRVQINREQAKRIADLVGQVPVVSSSPLDSMLIWGPPVERRRFLDMSISQMSPLYLSALQEYRAVLEQRNRILQDARQKRIDCDEILRPWDVQLLTAGSRILAKRASVLRELSPILAALSRQLSDAETGMELVYLPSVPLPEGEETTPNNTSARLAEALAAGRGRERRLGVTLVGPHRDDLAFRWGGRSLRGYGSQGEARVCALALKLALARYLAQVTGKHPVLLLDEVFAELDERRSALLLETLGGLGQILLATAKETDVFAGPGMNVPHTRFRVADGEVSQE